MLVLLSSEIAALAAIILFAALLGWIACLRGQLHRRCRRQPDIVERLASLRTEWCLSLSTVLGSL